MRAHLATLLIGACAANKHVETFAERVAKLDWSYTPSLPSPDAGTYMTAPGAPRDRLVSVIAEGHAFDRTLEAGASGLALSAVEGLGGLQRWELRESLWRGGWPYPVFEARGWSTLASDPPPDDLIAWIQQVPLDEPMTLVRARGRLGDGWVGMRAHPEIDLGMLPRRAPLGTAVSLPPIEGATFRLADGGGQLTEGSLDRGETFLLASAGEWLLQILRGDRELARFPIYVGIDAPDAPLLRAIQAGPLIGTAADAQSWANTLLAQVRTSYRLLPWKDDPLLGSAARMVAEDPRRDQDALLRALGAEPSASMVWTCDDSTVENCLDRWVWDPRLRAGLLSTELDACGLHATLDARGVHLTLVLADLS